MPSWKGDYSFQTSLLVTLLTLLIASFVPRPATAAELKEKGQPMDTDVVTVGPEISTEEVQKFLRNKSAPVIDVRSEKEYATAHIPGSINIYEKETEVIVQRFPDKRADLVIYCNGPFCHKVGRVLNS